MCKIRALCALLDVYSRRERFQVGSVLEIPIDRPLDRATRVILHVRPVVISASRIMSAIA